MSAPSSSAAVARSIQEYFKGVQDSTCLLDIRNAVVRTEISLVELIESMGQQLTSQDRTERVAAVHLLAGVLQQLPPGAVNEQEASALLDFLCDRMKDHFTVVPEVLASFLALAGFKNLPADGACRMLRSVFADAEVQTMTQAHRRMAYQIVSRLLDKRKTEVSHMGAEFVLGYIHMFDGEKDPRNLVIAFDTIVAIVQLCDPGSLAEDLFEVCACYYPIDFTPPVGDPYGVKKEELVNGLSRVLSATPLFAKYCLPMLIEKLSSDLQSAWTDSLHVLTKCCATYRPGDLAEYCGALRDLLVARVLSGEEAVAAAGKEAIRAVTARLASSPVPLHVTAGSALDDFVDGLLKETKRQLADASLKLASPACDILESAMRGGGEPAVKQVLESIVPLLVQQLSKYDLTRPREILLGLIQRLLESSESSPEAVTLFAAPALLPAVAPMAIASGDESSSLSSSALRCVALLSRSISPAVAAEQATAITCATLKASAVSVQYRTLAAQTVGAVYSEHCAAVQQAILPLLKEVLHLDDVLSDFGVATETSLCFLSHMAAVRCGIRMRSQQQSIGDTADIAGGASDAALVLLLEYLRKLCEQRASRAYSDSLSSVLRALATVMSQAVSITAPGAAYTPAGGVGSGCPRASPAAMLVLNEILQLVVEGLGEGAAIDDGLLWPDEAARAIAEIVRLVVSASADTDDVERTVGAVLEQYYKTDVILPISLPGDSFSDGSFFRRLCDASGDECGPVRVAYRRQRVLVLQAIVCSVRSELQLTDWSQLLDRLARLLASQDRPTAECACKMIGSLVNKCSQGSSVQLKAEKIVACVSDALRHRPASSDATSEQVLKNLTLCLAWLSKALLLRGDKRCNDLLSLMMELLDDLELGAESAAGCELIMQDHEDALSAATHAVQRLYYRQRFFTLVLPHIVRQLNATGTPNSVLAVTSFLLKYVPKPVLVPELRTLFPAVIKAFTSGDEELQLSMLTSLRALVVDAAGTDATGDPAEGRTGYMGFLASHVDSILPSLTALSTTARQMGLRIAALECLGLLVAGIPAHVLLPYQPQVLRSLASAVDDRKRLVRKAAVEARNDWFLLGSS